jgi:hypothetical protein
MGEPDVNGGERGGQGGYGNLFKIIDMIVFELNRTKRMFIIMILSVMIIPPVSLFITSVIFVPPFERGGDGGGIGPGGGDGAGPPPDRTTGFLERFFSTRNVPLLISIIWLGVGIRQWFVLSKWTKRYEQYKKRRDEADRKFDESISGSSNIGSDNSSH